MTSAPITSVGRAMLQRRVANLGLVLALIGSAFIVMRLVAVLAVGRPERLLHTSMITHYLGVALPPWPCGSLVVGACTLVVRRAA